MSFDGHVLCQRMLIGPWALTTLGAATAAAPVAPAASRICAARRSSMLGWIQFWTFQLSRLTFRPPRRSRNGFAGVLAEPLLVLSFINRHCGRYSSSLADSLIRRAGLHKFSFGRGGSRASPDISMPYQYFIVQRMEPNSSLEWTTAATAPSPEGEVGRDK
jgi:hypothetical protein